jgi:hypothetical protein
MCDICLCRLCVCAFQPAIRSCSFAFLLTRINREKIYEQVQSFVFDLWWRTLLFSRWRSSCGFRLSSLDTNHSCQCHRRTTCRFARACASPCLLSLRLRRIDRCRLFSSSNCLLQIGCAVVSSIVRFSWHSFCQSIVNPCHVIRWHRANIDCRRLHTASLVFVVYRLSNESQSVNVRHAARSSIVFACQLKCTRVHYRRCYSSVWAAFVIAHWRT